MDIYRVLLRKFAKDSAKKKRSQYYAGSNHPTGHELEPFASVMASSFGMSKHNVLKSLVKLEDKFFKESS